MAKETAYEAIYIIDAALPDDQAAAVVNKYREVIERGGGVIDDVDRGEPRRLAYEIKGHREGSYVVVNFHSDVPAKNELDRIFRISDDVLRYMILKQDPKADRFPSRTRAVEQERREREMAARAAAAPAPAPAAEQPVTELSAPVASVPGTDAEPETATDANPAPAIASEDTVAAAPEAADTEETA